MKQKLTSNPLVIVKWCLLMVLTFIQVMGFAAERKSSNLKFGVGRKSVFVMPDGDKAFVTGVSGLKFSDFAIRESDKMLTFEDPLIVDAEKSSTTHVDDYWCEQMTDCNLLVWTGWAKYAMGVTNEDDFAELLLKDPSVCKHGIIGWAIAKRGFVISESTDNIIAWVHADKPEKIPPLASRVAHYIKASDRLAYMQVDWQNRKGGHAVTCCGYAVKKGMNKDPLKPESLAGLFVINSDNDKTNGAGGRTAPNTIQYQRVWFDQDKQAFFSEFPNGDIGKIRFFCFMRAYDKKLFKFLKRIEQ